MKSEKFDLTFNNLLFSAICGLLALGSIWLFASVLAEVGKSFEFELRMKKPEVNTVLTQKVLQDPQLKGHLYTLKKHVPIKCNKNADFCDQGYSYYDAIRGRDEALKRLGCERIDFWFVYVPPEKVECKY
jgi:hypothetical protein